MTEIPVALPPADPELVAEFAAWSAWLPFDVAVAQAPRLPGVYLARRGAAGPLVYVGMAAERNGAGLRGRLRVYRTGKGAVSGFGEAAFDRALGDPEWLRARLAELEGGTPSRAKVWAASALQRTDAWICWATTSDGLSASELEDEVIAALEPYDLWNRARGRRAPELREPAGSTRSGRAIRMSMNL